MLVLLLLAAGCGTSVQKHELHFTIDDPAHRVGALPTPISVFDHGSYGAGADAHPDGVVSATQPYSASFTTTPVTTLFDNGPDKTLFVSVALPKLSHDGYWSMQLEPADGVEKTTAAKFTTYGSYFPDDRGATFPVRYTAKAMAHHWVIDVTLVVSSR